MQKSGSSISVKVFSLPSNFPFYFPFHTEFIEGDLRVLTTYHSFLLKFSLQLLLLYFSQIEWKTSMWSCSVTKIRLRLRNKYNVYSMYVLQSVSFCCVDFKILSWSHVDRYILTVCKKNNVMDICHLYILLSDFRFSSAH